MFGFINQTNKVHGLNNNNYYGHLEVLALEILYNVISYSISREQKLNATEIWNNYLFI